MEEHEREIEGATCECCHWSADADDCSLYNELLFDTAVLTPAYMLANIQAVMFPAGWHQNVEEWAHEVHDSLRRSGRRVPLVRYNALVAGAEQSSAFTLVH